MSGSKRITIAGKKMTAKWVFSLSKKKFVDLYKGTFEDVNKAWDEVNELRNK